MAARAQRKDRWGQERQVGVILIREDAALHSCLLLNLHFEFTHDKPCVATFKTQVPQQTLALKEVH